MIDPSTTLPAGQASYQQYEWDHRGRLTAVITKDGPDTTSAITGRVDYTYDALDRRVAKEVFGIESGGGETEILAERFVHDGDHTLAVLRRNGTLAEQILHGPLVDQVLAEERFDSTGTVREEVLFAMTDHLGSIRDVIVWDDAIDQVATTSHIRYSAFGAEISNTDEAVQPRYGFTGRDRDPETDLQFNRARYYDAETGRWISQDPIGFAAGDANLYRYVGNGPTSATDPSGLEEDHWHHTLLKKWLFDHGYVDQWGTTTDKVTGERLNLHDPEHGLMIPKEDHNRTPNGVHCKDSDGGTSGMTYDKHFKNEVESRLSKDGTISSDDLKAARRATVEKYPQLRNAPRATSPYPGRRTPLGSRRPGYIRIPNVQLPRLPQGAAPLRPVAGAASAAILPELGNYVGAAIDERCDGALSDFVGRYPSEMFDNINVYFGGSDHYFQDFAAAAEEKTENFAEAFKNETIEWWDDFKNAIYW